MIIGFVLDDSLDRSDGVQQYILALGEWLQKAGHEVHYLVGETKRDDIKNVHSLSKNWRVSFNQNSLSLPLSAKSDAIAKVLADADFDVLHVQMPFSPWLGAKVISAAKSKTAVVATFHILLTSKLSELAMRSLRFVEHKSLRRLDTIIAVSEPAADLAKRSLGLQSTVLPNVVDTGRFSRGKAGNRAAGRTELVFLGRLVQRKGAEYLLRAYAQLQGDVHLTVVGKGPLETKLKKLAASLQIIDRVTFAGYIDEYDKPDLLASADIAVYPSTGGESFGIVLIEAMAAGAGVVVGGDNPGYRSVLQDERVLINPKNIDAFAVRLQELIDDKKLRATIHTDQQQVVKSFDVEVVGPQIVEIYEQALSKRPKVG